MQLCCELPTFRLKIYNPTVHLFKFFKSYYIVLVKFFFIIIKKTIIIVNDLCMLRKNRNYKKFTLNVRAELIKHALFFCKLPIISCYFYAKKELLHY